MPLSKKQKKTIKNHIEKPAAQTGVESGETQENIDSLNDEISPLKKRMFTIVLLLIPVLFFIVLEGGLRIFHYGDDLSLFRSAAGEYSQYYYVNRWVAGRYFTRTSAIPDPPNDIFLKNKPDNGYRIFVLGGSTAAGWPYGNNIMFSRILQRRLADVFPDKVIEIVNTSISAVNTYTLLDFMDEICGQKPDAILIYAGHNEYYGVLGVASTQTLGHNRAVVKLYLVLKRFKTFHLIIDMIGKISRENTGTPSQTLNMTLMERMVKDKEIAYGSDLYQKGKLQFKNNLSDIIKKARRVGVPVVLSELVSNVKDQPPFVSLKNETGLSAEGVYFGAKVDEQNTKMDSAKYKYYLARDLDALRFRASEDFNDIIHATAKQYNLPVVLMKKCFEDHSENALLGNHLMADHLHPNIAGSFLMAEGFFQTMKANELVAPSWNVDRIKPSTFYRQTWGITALDSVYSEIRLNHLKNGWPFRDKPEPDMSPYFRLRTKVDSLAYRVWRDRSYTLEDGHADLAFIYESGGDYERACNEYKALMALKPYNVTAYLKTADMLIRAGKFEQAFPVLEYSLKIDTTAFAFKWLGHISLAEEKVREATVYLENVYKEIKSDPEVLFDLSTCYLKSQQFSRARRILDELELIEPEFPGLVSLKKKIYKKNDFCKKK